MPLLKCKNTHFFLVSFLFFLLPQALEKHGLHTEMHGLRSQAWYRTLGLLSYECTGAAMTNAADGTAYTTGGCSLSSGGCKGKIKVSPACRWPPSHCPLMALHCARAGLSQSPLFIRTSVILDRVHPSELDLPKFPL